MRRCSHRGTGPKIFDASICGPADSLLQPAHKGDERLYFVVGKSAAECLHFLFAVLVLHSFFDLLEHLLVGKSLLVLGIRKIFYVSFPARFRIAFALFSVTGSAMLRPVLAHVRGVASGGKKSQDQSGG